MSAAEPELDMGVVEPMVDNTSLAYDEVRSAILKGELAPGSFLSQVQLAAQLNVSRTPLREALKLLEHEGLIESDFNRRVRVAPTSLEDLEELYAMRIALEPLAVRLTVPQLSADDFDEIRGYLEVMRNAASGDSFDRSLDPHRAFHFGLISKVDLRMKTSVESLWDHAERYRVLYQESADDRLALLQLSMKEHDAIFEAAVAGESVRCSRLVAEHMARTALTVIAQVDGSRDPKRIREALRFVLNAA